MASETGIDGEAGGAESSLLAREIRLSRLLDAPRALVWKAWTEPEHIARWWGRTGSAITDCTVELRVGGAFRLSMQATDGALYHCRGTFREIVLRQRIVYVGERNEDHGCGAGLPPEARVTVTFEEVGARTRVTVHTRFTAAAARQAAQDAGYAAGWGESLERLGRHGFEINRREKAGMDEDEVTGGEMAPRVGS